MSTCREGNWSAEKDAAQILDCRRKPRDTSRLTRHRRFDFQINEMCRVIGYLVHSWKEFVPRSNSKRKPMQWVRGESRWDPCPVGQRPFSNVERFHPRTRATLPVHFLVDQRFDTHASNTFLPGSPRLTYCVERVTLAQLLSTHKNRASSWWTRAMTDRITRESVGTGMRRIADWMPRSWSLRSYVGCLKRDWKRQRREWRWI